MDVPFLPYALDVDHALVPGESALIVVRVDNERRPGDVPGMQRGWRNYGGILREVTLTATDRCYLGHLAITAVPQEGGGPWPTRAGPQHPQTPVLAQIALVIEGANDGGFSVARLEGKPTHLEAGTTASFSLTGTLPGVAPWSLTVPPSMQPSCSAGFWGWSNRQCRHAGAEDWLPFCRGTGRPALLNGRPIFPDWLQPPRRLAQDGDVPRSGDRAARSRSDEGGRGELCAPVSHIPIILQNLTCVMSSGC